MCDNVTDITLPQVFSREFVTVFEIELVFKTPLNGCFNFYQKCLCLFFASLSGDQKTPFPNLAISREKFNKICGWKMFPFGLT